MGVALFVCCILSARAAFAVTHYVATNGSDTNPGLSTTSPWLHAPGMRSCSGNCASYTPAAGDQIILRGGDTWHFSTGVVGLPWNWSWSGSSGNRVYVGVDHKYFSGASWTRPILTGDNPFSTAPVGSCVNNFVTGGGAPQSNVYLLDVGADNVTFDNFELSGFCTQDPVGTGGNYASMLMVGSNGSTTAIIQNFYFHGWTHTAGVNDQGMIISGDNANNNPDAQIVNSVVDGSDSDENSFQVTGGGPNTWIGNYFGHIGSGLVNGGIHIFRNNTIENIGPSYTSSKHTNMFYVTSGPSSGTLVSNNIFRHVANAQTVVIQVDPCNGGTDVIWNNLIYDTPGSNVLGIAVNDVCSNWSNSSFKFLNNVVQSGVGTCVSIGKPGTSSPSFASQLIENNLCINDAGTVFTTTLGTNPVNDHNALRSTVQATADGFTAGELFAYSPTNVNSVTVAKGINLSSLCTGELLSLCSDATYGASYNSIDHVAITGARASNGRPANGAWDIGAYQFLATQSVNPPNSLQAMVR
jgi:hypothetical protein